MYVFLVELINLAFSDIAIYIYCFLSGVPFGYCWAKYMDKLTDKCKGKGKGKDKDKEVTVTHIDSTCLPDNYPHRFNIKTIYSNDRVLKIHCDNINGKVCKITNQRCKFF